MKNQGSDKHIPALLFAIVMDIIQDMPLDARVGIADLEEDETLTLELTLGRYLQYRLAQLNDDRLKELTDDCLSMKDRGYPAEIDEAQTILRTVWKILGDTDRLRNVK